MDWDDIRVMIEVGRANSFTGAAVSLGVSKATVSRRIATLEAMAGVRLFQRLPGGSALTPQGEEIISRALRIEDDILDLERALRSMRSRPNRMVAVRMSEGVASYLITPVMAGQALGPLGKAAMLHGVDLPPIKIVGFDPSINSDIDIIWQSGGKLPPGRPNDRVRKLADVHFVPFLSDDYMRLEKLPSKFDDLYRHKLVTLDAYTHFRGDGWENWHNLLSEGDMPAISTAWSCSVGHLTLRGAGIGVLPTYSPLYADGLRVTEITSPSMIASLWMVCGQDTAKDPLVKRCMDGLWRIFSSADWMHP
ncbi:LysR family transcriptional regulator [Magnetospirillum fulvum]|uniref:HTH lysR-type domain-containing protein n=1 Tax=Magnetospirillum fulvum MGU-K5 TaxID=1316936 RepID=S9SCA2_MAGFU|nr:LysR family transcriptional regulator [Magnetospirillum fulvum]EPY03517.1 hypothetical protein K678_00360 [Magnetospirillum fulvum MGU-K5]